MEDIFVIETRALGKLRILALINDVALLEKQYETPEKYIVAVHFDMNSKSWGYGCYRDTLEEGIETFKEKILD